MAAGDRLLVWHAEEHQLETSISSQVWAFLQTIKPSFADIERQMSGDKLLDSSMHQAVQIRKPCEMTGSILRHQVAWATAEEATAGYWLESLVLWLSALLTAVMLTRAITHMHAVSPRLQSSKAVSAG